ncbi:MAG: TonB-dependent receptor [Flavobacteriales bacterium]|nr:TonB-dependent receptor [Flavobacteriales bacterium]
MKKIFFLIFLNCLTFSVIAQTNISGKVIDASTGEALIGATIMYGKGQGTATDFDGNFSILIPTGERSIKVSYVGYKEINKIITVGNKSQILNFKLKTVLLNEVQVVADIARDRETPVAFSTIPMKQINEELASQDIPMVLNSTPGVYATQSGGGDGDARITIRGFNQRNVAVMIDGIPVNDMENGWVYWSNWFGLDAVTSNIQIQRGLGASKIAIPSVGGTMNILTKGTGNKAGGIVKQSIGSFGKLRTSVGYNSGRMENGWGFTLAGSYKKGNGFVDETWSEGFFYYAKVQKEIGNHILSFSAMGAPQKHGQRSYKSDIATYDTSFARSLGDTSDFSSRIVNKGINYNKHWGFLDRWTIDSNGDTLHNRETLNTKQNYYHKPQFSLRDFWTVNDKFYISNILYASIGNGGGTGLSGNTNNYDGIGQYNLQQAYNSNSNNIDALYSDTENKAGTYLRSSINNHYWYGGLSTLNYQLTDNTSLSSGLDMRYYKGEHYREVYDLLGADYAIDASNGLQSSEVKRVGDKVGYNNDGIVKWSGVFSQMEYSNGMLSTFFNISASNSAYKRIDYFRKKDLVLDDTTYFEALGTSVATELEFDENGNLVGANKTMALDTVFHNGVAYTMNSPEAKLAETTWKWIRGFTIKSGANFNLDEYNNVFINLGYISKAPRFNNVYYYDNSLFRDIKNEIVQALEGGYSYRSSKFSANLNGYYTLWQNKPSNGGVTVLVDDVSYRANINGMDALHKGIEMDFSYKILSNLGFEGLVSLGDWKWMSSDTVRFLDDNNNPITDDFGNEIIASFDADGVHVGDAAQTQFGFSVRYEPSYNSYIKLRSTYFANYYADFDPLSLNGANAGRESWEIPSYNLIDLHAGYKFKISQKTKMDIKLSILNLFDEMYISDAQNNDPYNASYQDFDAKSAGVFFGLGRRINLSAKFTF